MIWAVALALLRQLNPAPATSALTERPASMRADAAAVRGQDQEKSQTRRNSFKEPLIKSHMAAHLAWRDGMQGRRRREWPFPSLGA